MAERTSEPDTRDRSAPGTSASIPHPLTATEQDIIAHVEAFMWRFVETINSRSFASDNTHPNVSSDFLAEAGLIGYREQMSLSRYIIQQRSQAAKYPKSHLKVEGVTTNVMDHGWSAESYVNVELHDAPEGIVQRGVTTLTFNFRDADWWLTKAVAIRGPAEL